MKTNAAVLDFALIGVPKSGTSSLFEWLDAHPEIQGSAPKETFFFMDPAHPLAGHHGSKASEDDILAFEKFYDNGSKASLRFEGTTHTYYQAMAREWFVNLTPKPCVAMLLREPARRLLSSFRFTRDKIANCDRSLTFNQYVHWLLAGKTDRLDQFYIDAGSLWIARRELELGQYVRWIDWWLEELPRECFRLVLFEQMQAEPCATTMALCDWLDVDSGWYLDYDFNARNPTYPVSMQGLHRIIRRLDPLVPRSLVRDKVKAAYLRLQSRGRAPDQDYEEGLRRLRAYFAPYNRELAERYGLALQRWWGEGVLYADR